MQHLVDRIAHKVLRQAGFADVEEVSRTLNSLIKYTDGLWKSDRQGMFILRDLQKSRVSSVAESWARSIPGYSKQHTVLFEGAGSRHVRQT